MRLLFFLIQNKKGPVVIKSYNCLSCRFLSLLSHACIQASSYRYYVDEQWSILSHILLFCKMIVYTKLA